MSGRQTPPSLLRRGEPLAVIGGAMAMVLLWIGSMAMPMLVALLISAVVAGLYGAVSAGRLRRGPAGANIVGLYSLIGVVIVTIPLLVIGTDSLTNTQIILFGLAFAVISAMGGQVRGTRS